MIARLRALWRRWTYPPGVHARPRHGDSYAVTAIEYQLRPPAETPPAPRNTFEAAAADTTSLPATGGGAPCA